MSWSCICSIRVARRSHASAALRCRTLGRGSRSASILSSPARIRHSAIVGRRASSDSFVQTGDPTLRQVGSSGLCSFDHPNNKIRSPRQCRRVAQNAGEENFLCAARLRAETGRDEEQHPLIFQHHHHHCTSPSRSSSCVLWIRAALRAEALNAPNLRRGQREDRHLGYGRGGGERRRARCCTQTLDGLEVKQSAGIARGR
jgi:hypothetical protein